MSTNFFSSLNGKFDLNASMSSLYGDYNTIKSGAYGSLMKSYVGKVGNKAALNAYRETGSTATASDASNLGTSKKTSSSKSNFLDSYFADKSSSAKKASTDTKTETASASSETAADKYAKNRSSWLDDQLKQYDKDANKTTAADTSVSMDTTI